MAWYQWAFSGIVGAVLVVGVTIWQQRKKEAAIPPPNGANPSATPQFPPVGVETKPSAREITSLLVNLPPYDKLSAPHKYSGLPVQWRLLYDALTKLSNEWAIILTHKLGDASTWVSVRCTELPPGLKIAERGAVVWVRGFINYVESGEISLRGAEILSVGEVNENAPGQDTRIETAILTHPDQDHDQTERIHQTRAEGSHSGKNRA